MVNCLIDASVFAVPDPPPNTQGTDKIYIDFLDNLIEIFDNLNDETINTFLRRDTFIELLDNDLLLDNKDKIVFQNKNNQGKQQIEFYITAINRYVKIFTNWKEKKDTPDQLPFPKELGENEFLNFEAKYPNCFFINAKINNNISLMKNYTNVINDYWQDNKKNKFIEDKTKENILIVDQINSTIFYNNKFKFQYIFINQTINDPYQSLSCQFITLEDVVSYAKNNFNNLYFGDQVNDNIVQYNKLVDHYIKRNYRGWGEATKELSNLNKIICKKVFYYLSILNTFAQNHILINSCSSKFKGYNCTKYKNCINCDSYNTCLGLIWLWGADCSTDNNIAGSPVEYDRYFKYDAQGNDKLFLLHLKPFSRKCYDYKEWYKTLRIYFLFDFNNQQKLVIGHIGRHPYLRCNPNEYQKKDNDHRCSICPRSITRHPNFPNQNMDENVIFDKCWDEWNPK